MLTSHRVGLQRLELCQMLWTCSKDLPENANLSFNSSEKFWLEIRDAAKGQISSKCRSRAVEDQDWKKTKKVQDFCQSCFLSSSGQMVDWVRINTRGGQLFPVTRGLKSHSGFKQLCWFWRQMPHCSGVKERLVSEGRVQVSLQDCCTLMKFYGRSLSSRQLREGLYRIFGG